MNKSFYIRAEDFVVAYIGPFSTIEQVEAHKEMCTQRGDSAVMTTTEEIGSDSMMILTPEEDIQKG